MAVKIIKSLDTGQFKLLPGRLQEVAKNWATERYENARYTTRKEVQRLLKNGTSVHSDEQPVTMACNYSNYSSELNKVYYTGYVERVGGKIVTVSIGCKQFTDKDLDALIKWANGKKRKTASRPKSAAKKVRAARA